jgi:hypothetical protein
MSVAECNLNNGFSTAEPMLRDNDIFAPALIRTTTGFLFT